MGGWQPINARARIACDGLDERERLLLVRAILARISDPRLTGHCSRLVQELDRALADIGGGAVGRRSDGSPIGPYGSQNHPLGRAG